MMRRIAAPFIAMLALVALSACAGGAEAGGEWGPLVRKIVDRDVTIQLRGDDDARFEGPAKVRLQLPQELAPLSLLVIGSDGYLDVGRGVSMNIGITLVNTYEGDGEYELLPHVRWPKGSKRYKLVSGLQENSRVTFYVQKEGRKVTRGYDRLGAPCAVELSDSAETGRIDCPVILDPDKRHKVSFRMTWRDS